MITEAPRCNVIWLIVDWLTKSAHFLAMKTTFNVEQLANLYIKETVRLHGIPLSIVFDRDTKFTLNFGRNSDRQWVLNYG